VRAKHVGKDIMASLRILVDGEIREYTKMLTECRNEDVKHMEAGSAEPLAYGTAMTLGGSEEMRSGVGLILRPPGCIPAHPALRGVRTSDCLRVGEGVETM
jgi:hypothetical protein